MKTHAEKRQQTNRLHRLARLGAAGLLGGALLAACGGLDDDANDQPALVPAAAAGSPLAFTDFLRGLATSETDEPLSLEGFVAPVDDTGEPVPVT